MSSDPVKVKIPTADGDNFDGYMTLPPGGKGPGVIMIPEIFGINDSTHQCAELFAQQGYVVLALDIFWRMERNIDVGYGETGYEKAFAMHAAYDYEQGVLDMGDAVEHLRRMDECTGKVFVTGYCLGGTMSYLAAARLNVDAAAGYYGTRIHLFLDDGPKIDRPLLLHFGRTDPTTPPKFLGPILQAVEGNANVTSIIYEDSGHAFANPIRADTYVPADAERANARTFELFARHSGDGD
jgi:carboxymethylenebutenolidase